MGYFFLNFASSWAPSIQKSPCLSGKAYICKHILRISPIGSTKAQAHCRLTCLSIALLRIVESKIACTQHSHSSGCLSTNAVSKEVGRGWGVRSDSKGWWVPLHRRRMPRLTTESTVSLVMNSSVNVPVILRHKEKWRKHQTCFRMVCEGEKRQRAKFYRWWCFLTLLISQTLSPACHLPPFMLPPEFLLMSPPLLKIKQQQHIMMTQRF